MRSVDVDRLMEEDRVCLRQMAFRRNDFGKVLSLLYLVILILSVSTKWDL